MESTGSIGLFDFVFICARTNAKIFFYSCSSIWLVIPDLIEKGVDILKPGGKIPLYFASSHGSRTECL